MIQDLIHGILFRDERDSLFAVEEVSLSRHTIFAGIRAQDRSWTSKGGTEVPEQGSFFAAAKYRRTARVMAQ
jgi:hypothetical protein